MMEPFLNKNHSKGFIRIIFAKFDLENDILSNQQHTFRCIWNVFAGSTQSLGRKKNWPSIIDEIFGFLHPQSLTEPLNSYHPKRTATFQKSLFKGELLNFQGVFILAVSLFFFFEIHQSSSTKRPVQKKDIDAPNIEILFCQHRVTQIFLRSWEDLRLNETHQISMKEHYKNESSNLSLVEFIQCLNSWILFSKKQSTINEKTFRALDVFFISLPFSPWILSMNPEVANSKPTLGRR